MIIPPGEPADRQPGIQALAGCGAQERPSQRGKKMDKKTLETLRGINRKLYSSMKAFQIAAQESGSLVFTYDIEKQTIFVDEQTAEAFGVTVEQPGVPYEMMERGIIAEDSAEEYLRIHEAILGGDAEAGGVVKLVRADGTKSIQRLKLRAIFEEGGVHTDNAVGIYRDITDRYIRDREQERYRQIVYSSDRFTYRFDRDADVLTIFAPPSECEGVEVKYQFERFFSRLRQGEFCPKSDIIILNELFTKGSDELVQIQLYSAKTGALHWYGITANVVFSENDPGQVFGTISDLTELKKREENFRKLERVLQTIKDDYIGIFEIDLEKDRYSVLYYNAQHVVPLEESGCYSEMMPRIMPRIVAPEFQKEFLRFSDTKTLRKMLMKDRRMEFEYMTAFAGRAWLRSTFQTAESRDGVPMKVIMYQSDIDQMKIEKLRQQQAIQDAYRYAESANMAKTDFLSRMSHDIRTPMNAIIGMTAIAGANLEDTGRVYECLNKITTASKHLLSLINEVLDMNKIESGAIELQEGKFNLADLIDNMVTMVLPQINEHSHELQVSVSSLKHEWVVGDSLRIQQAFVNLISNAVKYTPDGGKIHVTLQERPSHSQNYGEYEFCFEDNGIGMSEEFQRVLFEPFTRAEDSRLSKVTGTGLGMTITRNLIRMMDGDIRVESELGKGSKFVVTIHLKIQEDDVELPENLLNLPVLVADDDEITCRSACLILDDIGMQGEWCLSGEEAVRRVRNRHEIDDGYFAVILDWKMPDMDGVATARAIRDTVGPGIPIIFLTAYDWSEIEAEARAAGVDHFLSKPLFKSRLVNSFRELTIPRKPLKEDAPVFTKGLLFEEKHILLAEDNELNAEIARELLQMTGVSVEWAGDGAEAVSLVESSAPFYYDLIFMDIQMPGLDGYNATAAIRSLDRDDVKQMPIVAMTANAFAEDINHAVSAGMNEHIAKPVDMAQLERIMIKYLSRRA